MIIRIYCVSFKWISERLLLNECHTWDRVENSWKHKIMNGHNNNKNAKSGGERDVFFEIPIITASSPSVNTDSDASPVYVNISKRSFDRSIQSDEEADTSFINNNNTVNGRVSVLRSLSPGNLNASRVSRGVSSFRGKLKNRIWNWNFDLNAILMAWHFRMFDVGPNHWQMHPKAVKI